MTQYSRTSNSFDELAVAVSSDPTSMYRSISLHVNALPTHNSAGSSAWPGASEPT